MIVASDPEGVVIVGSGIIGLACAHDLDLAGYAVAVIDSGSISNGCSHGNCGDICPSHVLPLTEPAALRTAMKSLFRHSLPGLSRTPAF